MYSKRRPLTCCIAKHFSRSVSVSFVSRNISPKAVALFSLVEDKNKNMGSDPKISTIPRVTISRLFFKKVSFLKLSTTFPILISEGTLSTIS